MQSDAPKSKKYEYWQTYVVSECFDLFCDRFFQTMSDFAIHSQTQKNQHLCRRYLLDPDEIRLPRTTALVAFDYIQNVPIVEYLSTIDAYQKSIEVSYLQINVWINNGNNIDKYSYQIICGDSKHDTSSAVAALELYFDEMWDPLFDLNDIDHIIFWSDNSPKEFGSARLVKCLHDLAHKYEFRMQKVTQHRTTVNFCMIVKEQSTKVSMHVVSDQINLHFYIVERLMIQISILKRLLII